MTADGGREQIGSPSAAPSGSPAPAAPSAAPLLGRQAESPHVLAFDLGASSGRAIIGTLQDGRLSIEEIHRFPNEPVQAGDHIYWDILRLLHEVKRGILKAERSFCIDSIGIDSWAVDFGLLDSAGELLGNPYHYRDHQTDGMMDEVFAVMPREEVFTRTGIQFMPINTVYHLAAMRKRDATVLREGETFLMIPDLLRYYLTDVRRCEFTNATTTQLWNPRQMTWDADLLERLNIPRHLFTEPVQPGTVIGPLGPGVCEELGVQPHPVIAVAEHDTASAVAAVPATEAEFAYLICGTWSLLGTEVTEPVLTEQALEWNFTNEGGVNHTYRLLKNIMGLWLLQECRHAWEKEGHTYSFADLVEMASDAVPFAALIDPDAAQFLNPPHMPTAIHDYCVRTGQAPPETIGATVRCIMESLALKYRYVLERTERLAGTKYSGLHMVGGGIHNETLCQFTADAIGRPVWAGPAEASAIGNVLVQLIALGHIDDLAAARQHVRDSFPLRHYEPQDADVWDEVYGRFQKLVGD